MARDQHIGRPISPARAQDVTGRIAMEAVASISVSSADGGDPFLMFDQISTVGVGRGWDALVRPWARRMPGGDWAAEMYQLQVRYTRVSREFVVDRFETLISPAIARGVNIVGVRTLSPHWFTAGRLVGASTPILTTPSPVRHVGKSAEATIGYRLTPSVTFRAAYQGSQGFSRSTWQHAVAVSTVWARRWW